MGETTAFHNPTFVRTGFENTPGSLIVDPSLLAVMEYARKAELLDEIFAENQGAGEEQITRVQIYQTKSLCSVYQVESPKGLSKVWWPYDPRFDDPQFAGAKLIKADIPKGTVVGVGIVGNTTRWYIASTYKGNGPSKRVPFTWRLQTLDAIPALSAGAPQAAAA
jgi:hypothetical protein